MFWLSFVIRLKDWSGLRKRWIHIIYSTRLCFQESHRQVGSAPPTLPAQHLVADQGRPRGSYPEHCGLDCKSGTRVTQQRSEEVAMGVCQNVESCL